MCVFTAVFYSSRDSVRDIINNSHSRNKNVVKPENIEGRGWKEEKLTNVNFLM